VCGVKTAKGEWEADQVVIACGAWSGILAAKLGLVLPQKPFRGQVVLYRSRPGTLGHIFFTGLGAAFTYLVPRQDGRIFVGSTLEDSGFDKTTTPAGMEKLKKGAERLLPGGLHEGLVEAVWAGLRPGSMDGWPYLGPVTGHPGLWLATGHFTHGLLQSAVTGLLMSELITCRKPSLDIGPFALNREPHQTAGL
jgi:glycine oxidase